MYHFDRAPLCCVRKVDITAAATALAAAEPLTLPTKLSTPLEDLNTNTVDALTNALATELAPKHRCTEATYAAHTERVPVSDPETETE